MAKKSKRLGSSQKDFSHSLNPNKTHPLLTRPGGEVQGAGPANEGFYGLSAKTIDGFLAVKESQCHLKTPGED